MDEVGTSETRWSLTEQVGAELTLLTCIRNVSRLNFGKDISNPADYYDRAVYNMNCLLPSERWALGFKFHSR
jgi:hypothetical protein